MNYQLQTTKKIVVHPSYFPSISHFVAISKSETMTLEMNDNFQKQTNRNRMYIYSPNGIQMLNVPVKHSTKIHQKTRDIQIENSFDWQKQHFKSLEAAYRSSPFFEFFEDEIHPLFEKKHLFLMDLNLETMSTVFKCLKMIFNFDETTEYLTKIEDKTDFRQLINGKKDNAKFDPYTQVFEEKHGFINNLSVLDILFNEGRYALDYLKTQTLIIPQ
jgi:hypothetical protein